MTQRPLVAWSLASTRWAGSVLAALALAGISCAPGGAGDESPVAGGADRGGRAGAGGLAGARSSAGSGPGAGGGGGTIAGPGGAGRGGAGPEAPAVRSDAGPDAGPGGGRADGSVAAAEAGSAPAVADVSSPRPGRILPLVFIDVAGKAIPLSTADKIPGRMSIIEDHDGNFDWRDLKAVQARASTVELPIGINRHGNASDQYNPKKAYNIELRDDQGMDQPAPLVGMPPGSDWVLYACYNDKVCLRNVFSYDLGRAMGRWAPRTRFVEVAIDGKYNGLYVLIERIRRDKNRVDIAKPAADATGDLSGGYIFKSDSPLENPAQEWRTPGGLRFQFAYPKWDEATAGQKKALLAHLTGFETALAGPKWNDAQAGYRAGLDTPSFVDYLLVNELSNNADGLWRSAYFYKHATAQGGKIFAGPLWDYDLAYGNVDFRDGWRTDVWQRVHQGMQIKWVIFDLWTKLWGDAAFAADLKCRWQNLRAGRLDVTFAHARIDAWLKEIAVAADRDHMRWPVAGKQTLGNKPLFKTYAEDVAYFKSWIADRVKWIDQNLPGTCDKP